MKKYVSLVLMTVLMGIFISLFTMSETTSPNYPGNNRTGHIRMEPDLFNNSMKFGGGAFVNNIENPYLLTNRHVVEDVSGYVINKKRKVGFVRADYLYTETVGIVCCVFKNIDLALVKLPSLPKAVDVCKFSKDQYNIGDEVYYYGQPGVCGRGLLYSGKISGLNWHSRMQKKYGLDAINVQAIGGNSGSPIFNRNGKCVGILCSMIPEGMQTMFIKYSDIRTEFEKAGLIEILDGTYTEDLTKVYKDIKEFGD